MALKRPAWPAGRVVTLEHSSRVLADNPLGDPATRRLDVWLPPQYDAGRAPGRRFPVLFDLAAFTSSGPAHTGWRNFDENLPERLARLVHERRMGPCIVVFPDCFTAFGGNQYLNSPAVGRYADYLTRELIAFVDAEFRTQAAREHRGCFGKSSGGYGALLHGMKYTRYWGAVASHSGDALFDAVYRPDWHATLDELAKYREPRRSAGRVDMSAPPLAAPGLDDGRVARFLARVWQRANPTGAEIHCLMNLALAATFDADADAPNGFGLPFDVETGELVERRWRRWLRHDPVHLVGRHAANLKRLAALYIDCGWRDQYRMHYGSRVLARRLAEHGVAHRYEEFDGTHSGIDHRLDVSLPYLYKALA